MSLTKKFQDLFSLRGQTVLITGARRGLGSAIAHQCAEAGAHVVINDLDADQAEAKARELREAGYEASSAAFDVTDRQAVRQAVDRILAHCGAIDGVVSNAGNQNRKPYETYEEHEWRAILDTHVGGAFNVTQAVMPSMVARGRGRVVMVSSTVASHTKGTLAPYASAKGALSALTRELAQEFGSRGINTNAVAPGYLKTEFTNAIVDDPDFTRWLSARVPLGRWGKPEDVAPAVLFLLSDAGRFVNGHILTIDGGLTAAL
ncbi:glucose 1-dehydrogenase [Polaromonas sp.]|uniref:SDR family NAD(P)-dependent oxidoreductase n=1 Tax=Polaromonas sp. TaxID=1869339 RepID=UPI001D212131|nr:glucose 1-dehydrogenase [Polaromonas sp.]MBT9476172.1 glucose 1-dehydrogenase [Polaromonas sp.]